jgi:hypothetical protein
VSTYIKKHERLIRIIIAIALLIITSYFFYLHLPNIPKLNMQGTPQINTIDFIPDYGSLAALTLTVSIVILLGIDKEIWRNSGISTSNLQNTNYFKDNNLRGLIILALGVTAIVAIWLTIRASSISVFRYLIDSNYSFLVGDIFYILSFILITNICFTLHTTFAKIKQESSTQGEHTDVRVIRGLIGVPIQAVIIGLITILPRYSESGLTSVIGGIYGYVAVVAVLITVLVLLYLVWANLRSKTQISNY